MNSTLMFHSWFHPGFYLTDSVIYNEDYILKFNLIDAIYVKDFYIYIYMLSMITYLTRMWLNKWYSLAESIQVNKNCHSTTEEY